MSFTWETGLAAVLSPGSEVTVSWRQKGRTREQVFQQLIFKDLVNSR